MKFLSAIPISLLFAASFAAAAPPDNATAPGHRKAPVEDHSSVAGKNPSAQSRDEHSAADWTTGRRHGTKALLSFRKPAKLSIRRANRSASTDASLASPSAREGKYLVAKTVECLAVVDAQAFRLIKQYRLREKGSMHGLAVSPDGGSVYYTGISTTSTRPASTKRADWKWPPRLTSRAVASSSTH